MTDVPIRHTRRTALPVGVSYPLDSRYTLQWLVTPNEATLDRIPDNNDAVFKNHELPKPNDLILHYNYGAAATKHWGRNTEGVLDHLDCLRPAVPPTPTFTPSNRAVTIAKLEAGRTPKRKRDLDDEEKRGGPSGTNNEYGTKRQRAGEEDIGAEAMSEAKSQRKFNEDDVLAWFWTNTPIALERRAREEEERAREEEERREFLEKWRSGIPASGFCVDDCS